MNKKECGIWVFVTVLLEFIFMPFLVILLDVNDESVGSFLVISACILVLSWENSWNLN